MNNDKNENNMLQDYYKSEAKKMAGKPWYIRHKSTLLIVSLTILGWIFCAIWSHFFPYGIF